MNDYNIKYDNTFSELATTDPGYRALLWAVHTALDTPVLPFGSRYVHGPNSNYNDTDVLVLWTPGAEESAAENGYAPQYGYAGSSCISWRCDDVNLVFIKDPWDFFSRGACSAFARMNSVAYQDREDRAALHQYIADVERVGDGDIKELTDLLP